MPRAKIIKHLERENWDGPWKKIITLYFHAFMQFFFPQIHALIDWEKEIVFLDKELEQISRRTKKSVLIVDKLVKVFLNDGKEQWFIIHVEIQVQGQDEFPVRMFTYNYRAFDIHKKEVVSLAVLADDDPDWRPSSYGYSCLGLGMNFTFHTNKLLDYKADWEYLENSDNPFAMVVMCHLKNLETHQKPKERYQWKRLLLQKLLEKNWSHTQIADLFDYVDWLMILPESLEKGLEEEMAATAQKKEPVFMNLLERRGFVKGIEEGEQKGEQIGIAKGEQIGIAKGEQIGVKNGVMQGQHNALIGLMTHKFGEVPEETQSQIKTIVSLEELNVLLKRVLDVNSLEEMKIDSSQKALGLLHLS